MHGQIAAARIVALVLGASAPPVEVAWTGDAECPREQFQTSLDGYLAGVELREPARAAVRARRGGRGRWTLTLTLDVADGRSVRKLEGSSCASVSEAAAFVTAVAVDPTVVDRARPPGAPPDETTREPGAGADAPVVPAAPGEAGAGAPVVPAAPGEAGAVAPASETPASGSPPDTAGPELDETDAAGDVPLAPESAAESGRSRARARPRGFVRAAGGLEALGMPALGGQMQLAAGPVGRAWRVEFRGLYRFPTAAYAEGGDAGGRLGLWTVGAQGCGVLRPGPLEVPLCGGLEAGQALGNGFGFPGARQSRIPWAAVTVGAALAWAPRRWLALWLGVELAVPLLRGSFGIGGLGEIHQIAPVSPRAALGLELRFP